MDYSSIGARRFPLPLVRIINSSLTTLGSWQLNNVGYGAQNLSSLQAGVYWSDKL
jgi:hypothetical protein